MGKGKKLHVSRAPGEMHHMKHKDGGSQRTWGPDAEQVRLAFTLWATESHGGLSRKEVTCILDRSS